MIQIDINALGFQIPNFSLVLTFVIKVFFVIAGIMALFYLLLGAFAWITSGGSKEGIDKARLKIQSAVIGVILVVVVLSIIVTLEQVVFRQQMCFGISCPIVLPALLHAPGSIPGADEVNIPNTSQGVIPLPNIFLYPTDKPKSKISTTPTPTPTGTKIRI
ncbi:MAG: hypothetical protein WCO06_02080 [Candidatus Roizmanbacteria bacterium]